MGCGQDRHEILPGAKRVRFVKRAQQLGFTLGEVEGLRLLDDGQSCREKRLLAEQKLALIQSGLARFAPIPADARDETLAI